MQQVKQEFNDKEAQVWFITDKEASYQAGIWVWSQHGLRAMMRGWYAS
jgi:hypothetical protein